jgi:hypothetical protein
MASTRTPRGVSATRCWCRGWTSPYRTAGTRLSASTGLPAVTACKMNTSSSRRASSASVRGNSAAVVMDTNVRATTDNGVDPHDLCHSHHPGHARAAHAAGSSAGVDLQECCQYPEQLGVRVRPLVPVQHGLVATLVDQGHPRASHPQAHWPSPAEPPRRAGPLPSSDTPTHPARRRRQGARGGLSADAKSTPATTTPPPANFRRRPPSTNRARHQRGSPGVPLNAAKVGLKFAHEPKEIDVEPRILGTRLRITRTYRSYGARVPSR